MAQDTPPGDRPKVAVGPGWRLGLFLPYVLLALVFALWSAGWFWARGFAVDQMGGWLKQEAAAGRVWDCADRSVTGYPFRLELRCSSLKFSRSDGHFTLGPIVAVVQIYDPRHVLVEATGPFHTEQGDLVGDVNWKALEATFHATSDGFSRADLVVEEPKGRVTGADPQPIDFATKHLELHARPAPGRFTSEGAVDINLQVEKAAIPQLDAIAGNRDPADIAFTGTLSRATGIATGRLDRELEKWRTSDGKLDVTQLAISKGERRLQANGTVGLDEAHRPEGQFDIRAAGLEDLVGQIMGQRLGKEKGALIGGLVGQLLGGLQRGNAGAEAAETKPGDTPLKALPQLRLAGGRLMLGPIPIPNVALPVLY